MVATLVAVALYLKNNRGSFFYWDHLLSSFFMVLMVSLVGFFIAIIVTFFSFFNTQPSLGDYTETKLSALSNAQGIEGRSYFLGSGYINGAQQLSFIEDHGDYSIVNQVTVGPQALIYQNAKNDQPWMTKQEYVQDAWFLWPGWEWELYNDTYTFHIPEGSIVSDYVIDVNR
jgi:hypothetical protein